jgi:hypothetical protein
LRGDCSTERVHARTCDAALLIPLVLLASCGGDDPPSGSDREQVTTVVTGYFDALAAGDGDAACEVLTEAVTRHAAERPARTPARRRSRPSPAS